jgi:hypothetical protein
MLVLLIFSFSTTSPDGGCAGYVVVVAQDMRWVLEETKLRLTQPSLVELGLGLSLAKITFLRKSIG